MYNRYIPSADGTYRRETVAQSAAPCSDAKTPLRGGLSLPRLQLDTGDLLVLAILLLLLIDGDGDDPLSSLIAIAAFLLLQ
ncbi:MAG: hypothetical protein IJT18_02170 [Oscillospiraceae bacterium]|nr:hypothetical protein [Oscillospiraceae bacterium]